MYMYIILLTACVHLNNLPILINLACLFVILEMPGHNATQYTNPVVDTSTIFLLNQVMTLLLPPRQHIIIVIIITHRGAHGDLLHMETKGRHVLSHRREGGGDTSNRGSMSSPQLGVSGDGGGGGKGCRKLDLL